MFEFLRTLNPFSKPANHQKRRFEAAKVDRTTLNWLFNLNTIDQDLKQDLPRLRQRADELKQNNDYARKYCALCINNIVGPDGFTLQVKAIEGEQLDTAANKAIEAAFADWSRKGVCEVSGKMSFVDICQNLIGNMPNKGEFLVRKIRGSAAKNAYGFALQVLDPARIDELHNREANSNQNAIIMGVEVDSYQRPVNYYLLRKLNGQGQQGSNKHEVVPADEIIHGFVPEFPEQTRGIPWMASSMVSIHHLGEFLKAALLAARKGANTLGVIYNKDGAAEADATVTISMPGEYDTLPPGYEMQPFDSQYPDAMMAEFVKVYDRKIANGFNVSYASLANDLSEVSFSSIRQGVIEERDQWKVKQTWFTNAKLIDVYGEWLRMALLYGAITLPNGSALPAAKLNKFMRHVWQGKRWAWVDPKNDITAAAEGCALGVTSPQLVASQNGLDIEDVLDDVSSFEQMIKDKKITSINITGVKTSAQTKTQAGAQP